jgi:hypothetical protein
MRVLFRTDANYVQSPSARQWFYQMRDLVAARGIEADLNQFGSKPYDVAIIHWARPDLIQELLAHSPAAHIGIFNPGSLGFPEKSIPKAERRQTLTTLEWVIDHTDFFIVTGFMWRELLLPFQRRVYLAIDYDTPEGKQIKQHNKTNGLIIGYHGNSVHYKKYFFPHGANALRRLAHEYDITLKIITNGVKNQPIIDGVKTELIEFNLQTFAQEIMMFDIGICPVFSEMAQLADPLINIRNPNRVNSLLWYGIPSVTSPTPQACHDLIEGGTVLFAVSEEGWYSALKRLITQPELRNSIGMAGRKMVEEKFSMDTAADLFCAMLSDEISQPAFQKKNNLSAIQRQK